MIVLMTLMCDKGPKNVYKYSFIERLVITKGNLSKNRHRILAVLVQSHRELWQDHVGERELLGLSRCIRRPLDVGAL